MSFNPISPMRPALQRLLQRPAAYNLLKTLEAPPPLSSTGAPLSSAICSSCSNSIRHVRRYRASPALSAEGVVKDAPQPPRSSTELVPRHPLPRALAATVLQRLSTFEQLLFESDLVDTEHAGKRILDDPQHAHNLDIVLQLLQFRQRLYGLEGIRKVWSGLQARGIAIPIHGIRAEYLWSTLLELGLQDEAVLKEMYQHASVSVKEQKTDWGIFYDVVLRHFLRTEQCQALTWHSRFTRHGPAPKEFLPRLAEVAFENSDKSRLSDAFEQIYSDLEDPGHIYDVVVPLLCSRGQFEVAYRWHKLLAGKGDLPSSSAVVEPLLYHLALYGRVERLKRLTKSLVDSGVSFAPSTSKVFRDNTVVSREIMNRFLGERFAIPPKSFNDEFCARLFATKAFSANIVISGLQILGVDAIGPLSMRELATREPDPGAVLERIGQLDQAGISIGRSTYSQLVRVFAIERKADFLRDILASDQHPDVFEDRQTQESILASHVEVQDWRQVRRVLAILTAFSNDPTVERWNLLLRAHLRLKRWDAVKRTIDDMRIAGLPVTARSSQALIKNLLRVRHPGKRPVSLSEEVDDLGLVINILMGIVHNGATLSPFAWKEIFRRLGQTGRLDELERLALWLASFHSPLALDAMTAQYLPHRAVVANPGSPTYQTIKKVSSCHALHPLRQLFPPSFQRAVIAWGFTSIASSSQFSSNAVATSDGGSLLTPRPWSRGLLLLKRLRELGVSVQTPVVRKAYHQRLLTLFGPGHSNRPINRLSRERNSVPLRLMLDDAKQIWGSRILKGLRLSDPSTAVLTAQSEEGEACEETVVSDVELGR